jgi:hypothetical protein
MVTRRKIARPIRYSAQHTHPTTEIDLPIDAAQMENLRAEAVPLAQEPDVLVHQIGRTNARLRQQRMSLGQVNVERLVTDDTFAQAADLEWSCGQPGVDGPLAEAARQLLRFASRRTRCRASDANAPGAGARSGRTLRLGPRAAPFDALSRTGRDDCALGSPTLNETFQN